MTETQSKVAATELGSAFASAETADAALAESAQMEAIISELQTMTKRTYGQYCGLARAIEIIGERWSLLIIRDLLVGPKRFAELHRGLPRVAVNILSTRLKELENAGVLRTRVLPINEGSYVYELTDYGNELEQIVLALGRWGVQSLGEPQASDVVTIDSLTMAMRAAFQSEAAVGRRVSYELRLGDIVIHTRVDDGKLEVGAGPLPKADLVIEAGPDLKALMTGEVSPVDVLASGSVRVVGDPSLLTRFTELFQVPAPRRDDGAALGVRGG